MIIFGYALLVIGVYTKEFQVITNIYPIYHITYFSNIQILTHPRLDSWPVDL
jgi:hypothetical protein